jgi:putative peptide maturation system protein
MAATRGSAGAPTVHAIREENAKLGRPFDRWDRRITISGEGSPMTTPQVLEQVLSFLRAHRPGHQAPRKILAEFQQATRELGDGLEILWEGDAQRGHDLCVLIHEEHGTTSIAFSPHGDVPWAIRGTQRWSEGWVARLDGREISVGDLMSALEFVWGELRIGRHLLRTRVVQTELARHPLEVQEADIEEQRLAFMREHELPDEAAIEVWLRERRITPASLQEQWHERAIQRAFRRRVIASGTGLDGTSVPSPHLRFLRVPFPTREAAAAAAARVTTDPASLLAACFIHLESGENIANFTVDVGHGDLEENLWEALDVLPAHACVVACVNEVWNVFQRLRCLEIHDERQAEEELEARIFESWLDEKIARSTIEWFWGPQSGRSLGD